MEKFSSFNLIVAVDGLMWNKGKNAHYVSRVYGVQACLVDWAAVSHMPIKISRNSRSRERGFIQNGHIGKRHEQEDLVIWGH